jgi:Tfp pilus assembly protein PilE
MKTFTLLELLVVIFLVVGVIVYVQPAFERYDQRLSQAYAQSNLKRLYALEKKFFNSYDTYTSNLMALGWKPNGKLTYHYGFPSVLIPKKSPQTYVGNYHYAVMNTEQDDFIKYFIGTKDRKMDQPPLEGNLFGHGVLERDDKGIAFVAAAIANLDKDEALDRWVITDQGKLLHLCDDIFITMNDDPDCSHAIYNYGR